MISDKQIDELCECGKIVHLKAELKKTRNGLEAIDQYRIDLEIRAETLERKIDAIETKRRWRRFLMYCNTPCWRYMA